MNTVGSTILTFSVIPRVTKVARHRGPHPFWLRTRTDKCLIQIGDLQLLLFSFIVHSDRCCTKPGTAFLQPYEKLWLESGTAVQLSTPSYPRPG